MQCTDRDWFLEELPEQVDYSWLLRLMTVWVETESLPFKMGVLGSVNQFFPIENKATIVAQQIIMSCSPS
ncbi:pyridoxamine 5'-phosphate oxidase [Legionella spiritensis]|nr:pyridoxamine 5'-phosphate oxidase [Legionella spiritensis]